MRHSARCDSAQCAEHTMTFNAALLAAADLSAAYSRLRVHYLAVDGSQLPVETLGSEN